MSGNYQNPLISKHGSNMIKIPSTSSNHNQSNHGGGLDSNSNTIVLVSQPCPIQLGPTGNLYPTLLGQPLVPINTAEKFTSYSQKNIEIIEEVKREKESSTQFDLSQEYKKIKKKELKCDLHPNQLSDKCRKCKKIKEELTEQHKKYLTTNIPNTTIEKEENAIEENVFQKKIECDLSFQIHGDSISGNLNPLIFNNILSCQYFKEVVVYKNFNELVEEIIKNANNIEPWAVGICGIPSTFYCCLYKFMLIKLTEKQINSLIGFTGNSYVRIAGILYYRYLAQPKDLWKLLSPLLNETATFCPTVDQKTQLSIGEYVEQILKDNDHYGTRLPRIPTQIEREIKANLLLFHEHKKRKSDNENKVGLFVPERRVKVLKQGVWIEGKILKIKTDLFYRLSGLVVEINGGEELVDLGNVEIIRDPVDFEFEGLQGRRERSPGKPEEINKRNSRSKSHSHSSSKKSRSRSRSSSSCISEKKKRRKQHHHRHSRSRSRSVSRSRSRSRKKLHEKVTEEKKNPGGIYQQIQDEERNAALAKGRDYAIKPTSYKKSISVNVPCNIKKRSKSPSPIKQNVKIIEMKDKSPPKDKTKLIPEYSKEFLERQEQLKKQYTEKDTSIWNKPHTTQKGSDYIGPDVVKLG